MGHRDTTNLSTYAVMRPLVPLKDLNTLSQELRLIRIAILGIYHASVDSEWSSLGQKQSDFRQYIHVALSGSAQIRCDNQLFILEAGYIYWLPGNLPVERVSASAYSHDIIRFRFESPFGNDVFLDWPGRSLRNLGPVDASGIDRLLHSSPFDLISHIQLETEISYALLRSVPNLPAVYRRQCRIHAKYHSTFEYIRSHLGADLRIQDLAKLNGKSQHAFSMAFSRDLGISPKAYLNRSLNEEVCRLLMEDRISNKEISNLLRFSDEYYFSRYFYRMNGIRPSLYRQSLIRETDGNC